MIVFAVNVHTGGGKVLLDEILVNQAWGPITASFLDSRYLATESRHPVFYSKSPIWGRLSSQLKLRSLLASYNHPKVLFFGNLPPFFKVENSILFLQNCFLTRQMPLPKNSLKEFLRTWIESLILKWFAKNVDEIWVQTPWMEEVTRGYLPSANIKIHPLLPQFISIEEKERTIDIIYVGSVAKNKRLNFLLEALAKLDTELDYSVKATIVLDGDIPNTAMPSLTHIELSVVSNQSRDEIYHLYARSKVFVATSQYESFCLPLHEAQHYGCKLIAPNTGYADNVPGVIIYEGASAAELSQSLRATLTDLQDPVS